MDRDPKPWISALRASHDRLAAVVEPLTPDGVDSPSRASEWSVAQVLSHLGSQAEIFAAILDAAVEQRPLPGPEAFPPIWDAWNSRSPVDQVTDSVSANEVFVERVEALTDGQLESLQFAMFGMELDVVGFLQMRLSEHAVHSWDVAAALDPTARVWAAAVDLLIDTLPEMARRVGKPSETPRRIRVVTTAPARDLVLVAADQVQIDPWDGGPSEGVLRLPAEAFLRLVYGRLTDDEVPPIEGDADGLTLEHLRSVFPGF